MPKVLSSHTSITVPITAKSHPVRSYLRQSLTDVAGGCTSTLVSGVFHDAEGREHLDDSEVISVWYSEGEDGTGEAVAAILARAALDLLESGEQAVLIEFHSAGRAYLYESTIEDIDCLRRIISNCSKAPAGVTIN